MNAIYYARAIAVPVTSAMLHGVIHEYQRKLILRELKNNLVEGAKRSAIKWPGGYGLKIDYTFRR